VAEIIAMLVDAGADVDARYEGVHNQTPLHWAASSDDVDALDALLDSGADIEAAGAFNGVGGPLDNAVGFGQWDAARRLVERGAEVKLWHAAALGLGDRIEALFAASPPPASDAAAEAFWQACHGDQRAAAEYLADRGADLNWIGYDNSTTPGALAPRSSRLGSRLAEASRPPSSASSRRRAEIRVSRTSSEALSRHIYPGFDRLHRRHGKSARRGVLRESPARGTRCIVEIARRRGRWTCNSPRTRRRGWKASLLLYGDRGVILEPAAGPGRSGRTIRTLSASRISYRRRRVGCHA
jgi:hypothetical protein